ncbi:MAG: M48 family metallopeptidase [Alphaproteobacteria bacterium]|nr:M48 family metallopeptidase [Alphaproteobacteria bacterium]
MSRSRVDPAVPLQADLFGNAVAVPSPPTVAPPPGDVPTHLVLFEAGQRLELLIERSARIKRSVMRVDAKARTVVIVAPPREPMASIERFARARIGWALAALQGLAGSRVTDAVDIEHAGQTLTIAYELSARARRVALRVDARTGHVKLVVPSRMSRQRALEFARQNAGWIAARLKRRLAPVPLVDGATIPVFGQPHRIRHRPDARGSAWLQDGEIHVAGAAPHVARRVGDWLSAQLRARIVPLAREKAARIDRRVAIVSLRDTATQWGSCAQSGRLCFSLRLAFAPPAVVDYVVAHEVAHLVHHNHGVRFWALARKLTDGDMAACKAWLRRHGPSLMRYG